MTSTPQIGGPDPANLTAILDDAERLSCDRPASALELVRDLANDPDASIGARASGIAARCLRDMGQPQEALPFAQLARRRFLEADDIEGAMRARQVEANVHARLGDHASAIALVRSVAIWAESTGASSFEMSVNGFLANCYSMLGQHELAHRCATRCVELSHSANAHYRTMANAMLATSCVDLGLLDEALRAAHECQRHSLETGDALRLNDGESILADVHAARQEWAEVTERATAALKYAEASQAEARSGFSRARLAQGRFWMAQDPASYEAFWSAVMHVRGSDQVRTEIGFLDALIDAQEHLGLHRDACLTWRQKSELEQSVADQRMAGMLDAATAAQTVVQANEERERLAGELRRTTMERTTFQRKAHLDALTGALNRQGLDEWAGAQWDGLDPACLLVMDLDRFKRVNDVFGHAAGDQVLRRLAELVSTELRSSDVFVRWGGEEFVAILPNSDADDGAKIAERLRCSASALPFDEIDASLRATLTIGVAERRTAEPFEATFDRADAALYEGKRQGRDRVVIAG